MSSRTGAHRANHPDGDDDMRVSELIELLEEQEPDAEVLVMSHPNRPLGGRTWKVMPTFQSGEIVPPVVDYDDMEDSCVLVAGRAR
jgi:hypothetical protein